MTLETWWLCGHLTDVSWLWFLCCISSSSQSRFHISFWEWVSKPAPHLTQPYTHSSCFSDDVIQVEHHFPQAHVGGVQWLVGFGVRQLENEIVAWLFNRSVNLSMSLDLLKLWLLVYKRFDVKNGDDFCKRLSPLPCTYWGAQEMPPLLCVSVVNQHVLTQDLGWGFVDLCPAKNEAPHSFPSDSTIKAASFLSSAC